MNQALYAHMNNKRKKKKKKLVTPHLSKKAGHGQSVSVILCETKIVPGPRQKHKTVSEK
jgi:hypothetical protein